MMLGNRLFGSLLLFGHIMPGILAQIRRMVADHFSGPIFATSLGGYIPLSNCHCPGRRDLRVAQPYWTASKDLS